MNKMKIRVIGKRVAVVIIIIAFIITVRIINRVFIEYGPDQVPIAESVSDELAKEFLFKNYIKSFIGKNISGLEVKNLIDKIKENNNSNIEYKLNALYGVDTDLQTVSEKINDKDMYSFNAEYEDNGDIKTLIIFKDNLGIGKTVGEHKSASTVRMLLYTISKQKRNLAVYLKENDTTHLLINPEEEETKIVDGGDLINQDYLYKIECKYSEDGNVNEVIITEEYK